MFKRSITTTAIIILVLVAIGVPAQFPGAAPSQDSQPVSAKKEGTIRIGLSVPTVDMGNDFSFADTPMAVSHTLQVALTEDNVETVFLTSALPDKEAKQKKCDYVLYTRITRKKGGGGMFGSMMAPMLVGAAGMIPGVGMAGAIAAGVASSAISAASMAGSFKSKDEVSFTYSLTGVDGSAVLPQTTTKQKAKKDGEDVLTPQIRTATDLVLSKIKPRSPQS